MILHERVFEDYFGLLIPILIAGCLIVYVRRNRPGLINSFIAGPFNKVQFKEVQKNFEERTNTILFWCAVFLQGIYINTLFLKDSNIFYSIFIMFFALILSKHLVLKLSQIIFQKEFIFKEYYILFFINVVNLGLLSIPISITNIIYLNQIDQNQFQTLNTLFIIFVLLYLLTRLILMTVAGVKEKISYLHIIAYLCTLEILPIAVILSFFNNY
tara:strand:- start:4391 stop:5032 length:642 start_codon:yes stop_codon:yes gene_type:complete